VKLTDGGVGPGGGFQRPRPAGRGVASALVRREPVDVVTAVHELLDASSRR
jgi:hypothetical protein